MTTTSAVLLLAGLTLIAFLWLATDAASRETIHVACPAKAYFPTILANVAKDRGLFAKEGLRPKITIHGHSELVDVLVDGSADLVAASVTSVTASRMRGVPARIVATGAEEWSGWILGVRADSPFTSVKELDGKTVGITGAGRLTDVLALWLQHTHEITFSRVPVGAHNLAPKLLNGALDAAVIPSPLSQEATSDGRVRPLIDFASALPPNLVAGWAATEKNLVERRRRIMKGLNALYGALEYLRDHPDYAIKTIARANDIPLAIARMEYEQKFLRLSRDGRTSIAAVEHAQELAALGGARDQIPASEIIETVTIVPTRP